MITTTIAVEINQDRQEKVKDGIDFLLSHFEGRQRLFLRKNVYVCKPRKAIYCM